MKRFFLAFFLIPALAQAADYTVVVFDASGSMAERMIGRQTRMTIAKQALTQSLGNLNPGVNLGILVFQADTEQHWIYPLGTYDKSKVLHAIQMPHPSGGTPLGEYMKIGADELLKVREKNHNIGIYRLVIVTDGEADDIQQVEDYNNDIRSRGIIVNVIGVGMDSEHSLATKADSYQNANNLQALTSAISQVLAETPDSKDQPSDFIEGVFEPTMAVAALEQLSLFRNQPIGEKPPVRVVDASGNISFVTPPVASEPHWLGAAALILLVFGGIVVLGVVIHGIANS